MSEKLPAKSPLEGLKLLAQSLPKVAYDDDRQITPFRGRFYSRFHEMRAVANGYGAEEHITYVRMTKERFGIDLVAFYSCHTDLCESICSSLEAKKPYDLLCDGYQDLTDEESASLLADIDHPRGIDAIGLHYWDQINPLLEEAYAILDGESLNAPFLGRS